MRSGVVMLSLGCLSALAAIEWDWKTQGDLHEVMVMSILEQRPDRYEFIESVLRDEPDRVRAMAMKINWKIDHEFNIKTTETTYTLMTAAVLREDMDMIELLLKYGDELCVGESAICAVHIAKKYKKEQALRRLYKHLIEVHEARQKSSAPASK